MPLFDAIWEWFVLAPIWVNLPGLPWDFKDPKIFQNIGNALGVFLEVYMSFQETGNLSLTHILANKDLGEGLVENIVISIGGRSHTKKLDYNGVPFRCWCCNNYSHIAKKCSVTFVSRRGKVKASGVKKPLSQGDRWRLGRLSFENGKNDISTWFQ